MIRPEALGQRGRSGPGLIMYATLSCPERRLGVVIVSAGLSSAVPVFIRQNCYFALGNSFRPAASSVLIPCRSLMRCFSIRNPGSGEEVEQEEEEGEGINGERGRRRNRERSPHSDCSAATTSTAASPASATINLSRVYRDTVTTRSFNEIWSMIHRDHGKEGDQDEANGLEDGASPPLSVRLIARVLQPDRASLEEALRFAPPTHLTRLVSDYFDSSESTSHFCFSLHRAVGRARSLYAPIKDLIELLDPAANDHHARLTVAQCDWAFERLLEFDRLGNPFPAPSGGDSCSFQGMRGCFAELKLQLDLRLLKARGRRRLQRRAVRGSAACVIVTTVGVVVTGVLVATHAVGALMAGPLVLLGGCRSTRDLLGASRQKDYIDQLDAASRGTYVLNNDLDTIERLVTRLRETVESDRVLVRLGVESGRGQQHPIEEVVRQLRKTHRSFCHQLEDLEEHICLFFNSVNLARSLLLRQIQQQSSPP